MLVWIADPAVHAGADVMPAGQQRGARGRTNRAAGIEFSKPGASGRQSVQGRGLHRAAITANVLPPQINQTNPSVYLQNTAQGWTDLFWDLGDLGVRTEVSPSVTFPSILPDEFEVCQVVFAGPICSDTLCTTIEVAPGLTILVPNSFTPNGDGLNDQFVPIVDGLDMDSYEFRVFNRWGEELFLSTVPGEGWDGNYKGAPAQLGVYVWQVIAQDSMGGETDRKQGHVTLVR